MADRISTTQQQVDREKFDSGWELANGQGWRLVDDEEPSEDAEFLNHLGRTYWRPMEDAIVDYTTKNAGAIK